MNPMDLLKALIFSYQSVLPGTRAEHVAPQALVRGQVASQSAPGAKARQLVQIQQWMWFSKYLTNKLHIWGLGMAASPMVLH